MVVTTFSMTFLGVGSGLNPEMGNNNVLLESADGREALLLDCGYSTPPQLKKMGRLQDICHIAVTHVHMDHAGGLELLATFHQYVYGQRPRLYFPQAMYDELWSSLRGGLEATEDGDGRPIKGTMDMYFQVHTLKPDETIHIPGLPILTFRPTLHIAGKPAYSVYIGEDIYFSSDTQELPPAVGPTGKQLRAIFQDCQLDQHSHDVHTSLPYLNANMPPELKAITWLMHYSWGHDQYDPKAMGFAGFAEPMQRFVFSLTSAPAQVG